MANFLANEINSTEETWRVEQRMSKLRFFKRIEKMQVIWRHFFYDVY